MHYSLLLVGAHNGSKIEDFILSNAAKGQVLLIEPVPWLYQQLEKRFANYSSISLFNGVIAEQDNDKISFFAPIPSANEVAPWGDQLGSLNSDFATEVDILFTDKIEQISSLALSFESLIDKYKISSIDTLFTDTEGFDAKILATFPFKKIKPREIYFEYKHSDGVFNIGKNFASLLIILANQKYKIQVIDLENCKAVTTEY